MVASNIIVGRYRTDPEFQDLTRVFKEYGSVNPHQFHPADCSKAVAELRDNLVKIGKRVGQARIDADGFLASFDETGFNEEISVLLGYVQELKYSNALVSWINMRRMELQKFLNEPEIQRTLRNNWRGAQTAAERLELLRMVMEVHSEFYAGYGLAPPGPGVGPIRDQRELLKGTLGYVIFDHEKLRQGILPAIHVAPQLLYQNRHSFRKALQVAHHEYVHWFLAFLVAELNKGNIPADHPFFHDAVMEDAKFKEGAVINSAIYTPYRRQPEEMLCYRQDELFAQNLRL